MRNEVGALVCVVLSSCQALAGGSGTTLTFAGPPDTRVTIPNHVSDQDLLEGLPPIRVRGPEEAVVTVVLFDDQNGDSQPDEDEYVLRFPALANEKEPSILHIRVTPDHLEKLGKHRTLGVEVFLPSKKKRQFIAYTET